MNKINWKYAFGEIIIVMIGISLAFALNNFKESVQNDHLKKRYLENLKLDINEELQQLNTIDSNININIKYLKEIHPHLGTQISGRDTIINKVFTVAKIVTFNPENTTYQTLINSGDMKLIDNFDLRRMIEGHYSYHNEILQNYDRLQNIYTVYLGDFFIREIDFSNLRQGNFDFLDKPLFKSILSSIQGSYYLALNSNKKCAESNVQLLEAINHELIK